MARFLPLHSKCALGSFAVVDEDLFDRFVQYRWCFDEYGAYRHVKRQKIYLHKEILSPKEGQKIRHIDGDKKNNQRSNLDFNVGAINSQLKRGKSHSWGAKISASMEGVKHTKERCENISKAKLGKPNTKLRGKPRSEEAKAKQSKALTGRPRTQWTQQGIENHRAVMQSDEYRIKRSKLYKAGLHKQTRPEKLLEEALIGRNFVYAGLGEIDLGQPISSDFVALDKNILVQMDGCYHHCCAECGNGDSDYARKRHEKDARLTKYAESEGWTVIRIWEHEVYLNLPAVVAKIDSIWSLTKGRKN